MPATRVGKSKLARVQSNKQAVSRSASATPESDLYHHDSNVFGSKWAGSIEIKGQKLKCTAIFDMFWQFAAGRHSILEHRLQGTPHGRWTKDPILHSTRFCNTFRVADRVSQYLIREVIEKGSQVPEDVVFRVLLFNTFTRIETWELLNEELGPLTWERWNFDEYMRVLGDAKKAGVVLYTGAFQKPAPKMGHYEAYANHLELIRLLMDEDLTGTCQNAEYLVDVFETIVRLPSMGDFSTFQLLLSLSYTSVLNFSDNDFVVAGPGARSGIKKMFGVTHSDLEDDIMRYLQKSQHEHFERLGLQFNGIGPECRPMQLCDIEHTLCEVDKYSRAKHPSAQGLGGRTRAGGPYKPSPVKYAELCLPKAWSHPSRQIERIRPAPLRNIGKQYIINRIIDERIHMGVREYRILWYGYDASDATWTPEEVLREDAPSALDDYLKQFQTSNFFQP